MTITATTQLATEYGVFIASHHLIAGADFVSLIHGDVSQGVPVVRIQSACLFGQSLHSLQCDCCAQLNDAMQRIQKESGVLIFSPRGEGRGAGLATKVLAMEHERTTGCNMERAYLELGLPRNDFREFDLEVLALVQIGTAKRVRFLSTNQKKRDAMLKVGFVLV